MDDLDVGRIDEIRPILANVLFILLGCLNKGGKGINYLSNAPENTLFLSPIIVILPICTSNATISGLPRN